MRVKLVAVLQVWKIFMKSSFCLSVNMNAVIPLSSLRDYDYTAQHNIIEGHKFTQTLKYGLYEGVNSVKKHNYNMAKMMLLQQNKTKTKTTCFGLYRPSSGFYNFFVKELYIYVIY